MNKEAKFVTVALGNCFKGSGKMWEKWYSFIITPTAPKQKADLELLVYTLNEKYQPTDIKLAWLFKKEFDDWNKTYGCTCVIAWTKYFVNFQKAKDKDKETGKDRFYIKMVETPDANAKAPVETKETETEMTAWDLPF